MVFRKERQIATLASEIADLKKDLLQKRDEELIPALKESQNVDKTFEQKDAEIAELKKHIEMQNELIQMLQTPVKGDEDSVTDLDALKGRKYMFVGFADDQLPDLRRRQLCLGRRQTGCLHRAQRQRRL